MEDQNESDSIPETPINAVVEALAELGLGIGLALKLGEHESVGAFSLKDITQDLDLSIFPPETADNPSKLWGLSVPVEICVKYDADRPDRARKLHDFIAERLTSMGFRSSWEEFGNTLNDGSDTCLSTWDVGVRDPTAVAAITEQLLSIELTQYPDGDDWM